MSKNQNLDINNKDKKTNKNSKDKMTRKEEEKKKKLQKQQKELEKTEKEKVKKRLLSCDGVENASETVFKEIKSNVVEEIEKEWKLDVVSPLKEKFSDGVFDDFFLVIKNEFINFLSIQFKDNDSWNDTDFLNNKDFLFSVDKFKHKFIQDLLQIFHIIFRKIENNECGFPETKDEKKRCMDFVLSLIIHVLSNEEERSFFIDDNTIDELDQLFSHYVFTALINTKILDILSNNDSLGIAKKIGIDTFVINAVTFIIDQISDQNQSNMSEEKMIDLLTVFCGQEKEQEVLDINSFNQYTWIEALSKENNVSVFKTGFCIGKEALKSRFKSLFIGKKTNKEKPMTFQDVNNMIIEMGKKILEESKGVDINTPINEFVKEKFIPFACAVPDLCSLVKFYGTETTSWCLKNIIIDSLKIFRNIQIADYIWSESESTNSLVVMK